MNTPTPAKQLEGFIAKYSPKIQKQIKAVLARMRKQLPGATELVYDNYNALVIGFGPNERPSHAILSLAAYADHVSICFLYGAKIRDPEGLLQGSGNQVRHIRLEDENTLEDAGVQALLKRALTSGPTPMDHAGKRALIIQSISAKQRPRRSKDA